MTPVMTADMTADARESATGRIAAVRGNVVDVQFQPPLPPRHRQLRTGKEGRVVLEVHSHVSTDVVRCIALSITRRLS